MRSMLLSMLFLPACTTYLEPTVPLEVDARVLQQGTWSSAEVELDETDGWQEASALSVAPSGAVEVIYGRVFTPHPYDIVTYSVDPRTSHPPEVIAADLGTSNTGIQLAAATTPSGERCLATTRHRDQSVYLDCGAVQEEFQLGDASVGDPPAVAVDASGGVHLAWHANTGEQYYRAPDGTLDTQGPWTSALDLAVDGDGTPWTLNTVYLPGSGWPELVLRHLDPDDGWVERRLYAYTTGTSTSMSIAAHGSSVAYAWSNGHRAYVEVDGVRTRLSDDAGVGVEVAFGPDGTPHVVWVEDDELLFGVFDGNGWTRETLGTGPEVLPRGYSKSLHLALDGRGVPHVAVETDEGVVLHSRSDAAVVLESPVLTVDDLDHGDLVVTEVFANPARATDAYGEWIEVYNASGADVDLDGLVIEDEFFNAGHVQGSTLVAPGTYAVLGRRDADSFTSIDVEPVGFYGLHPVLNNAGDRLFLYAGYVLIDSTPRWDSAVSGVSWQLAGAPDADTNDDPAAWCLSSTERAQAEWGTPGQANDGC